MKSCAAGMKGKMKSPGKMSKKAGDGYKQVKANKMPNKKMK